MNRLSLLCILGLLSFSPAPLPAQKGAAACRIDLERLPSSEVSGSVTLRGTAVIPPGHHLWLFARHQRYRTAEAWWPQGEAEVDPETGRWKALVNIGSSGDIGWDFDIEVAVFAPREHLKLKSQYQKVLQTNTPLEKMEAIAKDCAPVRRVVHKTGHD